jgi:hypothetical protein
MANGQPLYSLCAIISFHLAEIVNAKRKITNADNTFAQPQCSHNAAQSQPMAAVRVKILPFISAVQIKRNCGT